MNFSQTITELRKRRGLTQEELADKIGVSRQSVYKWESGQSLPETDKLIILADLFGVSIDALIKSSISNEYTDTSKTHQSSTENLAMPAQKKLIADKKEYMRKIRLSGAYVGLGLAIIIIGVALNILITEVLLLPPVLGITALFLFAAAGVAILIISGSVTQRYKDVYELASDAFSEKERTAFNTKFAVMIAVGVVLCIISVIAVTVIPEILGGEAETMGTIFMFLIVAAALFIFVYYGTLKAVYFPAPKRQPNAKEKLADVLNAVIMISATAIYVVCGLAFNLWGKLWILFPAGGFLCAIVSVILRRNID